MGNLCCKSTNEDVEAEIRNDSRNNNFVGTGRTLASVTAPPENRRVSLPTSGRPFRGNSPRNSREAAKDHKAAVGVGEVSLGLPEPSTYDSGVQS